MKRIKKIKIKPILKTSIITLLLTFISCNNSEFKNIEAENKRLKNELNNVKKERDDLKKKELEQNNTILFQQEKYWDESKALESLKDYYKFYKRDCRYRDEIIRRSDNNSFQISLKENCKLGEYWGDIWDATVYWCHIENDGSYKFPGTIY